MSFSPRSLFSSFYGLSSYVFLKARFSAYTHSMWHRSQQWYPHHNHQLAVMGNRRPNPRTTVRPTPHSLPRLQSLSRQDSELISSLLSYISAASLGPAGPFLSIHLPNR
jgi:hypothetical protein